jgi:hypothetical protein
MNSRLALPCHTAILAISGYQTGDGGTKQEFKPWTLSWQKAKKNTCKTPSSTRLITFLTFKSRLNGMRLRFAVRAYSTLLKLKRFS